MVRALKDAVISLQFFPTECNKSMSKSTPLNQLPVFSDDQIIKGHYDQNEGDDDATVQEVMGDLATSIPGFNAATMRPAKAPPPLPSSSENLSGTGMFTNPMSSITSIIPAQVSEHLWMGLMAAFVFIIVTLAPVDKLLAPYPILANFTYASLFFRAVLMALSMIAATRLA